MNITLPFSLVSNNVHLDRLEIIPAYFWMYNLYALERNSWKVQARDKRKIKQQMIETDYLAPDTAEEIISALARIKAWTGDADADEITVSGVEHSSRPTVIFKIKKAAAAYREMLLYYSVKTLCDYLECRPELTYSAFINEMETNHYCQRISGWVNLGGQITPAQKTDRLREKIRQGAVDSWDDVHKSYREIWAEYPLDKTRHAWEVYRYLYPESNKHPLLLIENFKKELKTLIQIRRSIAEHVYESRAKDFNEPFRSITYRNREEMEQVLGTAQSNSFYVLIQKRTRQQEKSVKTMLKRLENSK
jgi:hypothetical protein